MFTSKVRYFSDTIYGLSTAPGRSGVAVVRVSGEMAFPGLQTMRQSKLGITPRMMKYCKLFDPVSKDVLDEAMVVGFKAPHSFTGEDVVEYHVHGSNAVISDLLKALGTMDKTRPAEAGEFTERAFENEKLNVIQVEGLSDLLASETTVQRKQALAHMGGDASMTYEKLRQAIIKPLAHVEALIDFGDDELDVTQAAMEGVLSSVAQIQNELHEHLQLAERGELLRDGIKVSILGPPNAGKSSLLNNIANRDAAIVSPHAGTTRDIIQVPINLYGLPILFQDTAGIRTTTNDIEQQGIQRAEASARQASIKIIMFDVTEKIDLFPFQDYIDASTLIVLNKSDLRSEIEINTLKASIQSVDPNQILSISCQTSIEALLLKLGPLLSEFKNTNVSIITRERHRVLVQQCIHHLSNFTQTSEIEIACEELRLASQCIGKITGRIDIEQVLDTLFRDFCIGK